MEAFDHETLSTEALTEVKKNHQAVLLDSLALGLLMIDGNQTAVDLLRIDSLVQFLWATAKELNLTIPAFGQREWDTKTLLAVSQIKSQFNTAPN